MNNMVYVAADPEQPGAAWAICADRPEWKKETAKTLAGWIKEGANVQHVEHAAGCAMLEKWVRPERKTTTRRDLHPRDVQQ